MKLIILFIALFVTISDQAQSECKVLLPSLDSVYIGKCKNGLAHGAGEAWGRFHYKGRFSAGYPEGEGRAEFDDGTVYVGYWKKGLRNGKGTVIFKENGKEVQRTWIWENDIRQKEVLPPPYKVITQRNVSRMRVYKQGVENQVWFYPNSMGGVSTDFQDMQLSGSSGRETKFSPKFGFEDVMFPFKGSIRYKAWNKLRTTQFEILVEIEISEAGNWIVEIQN
ncbi:MAG: hypothetical protein WC865_01200 [Bacteroidales bacterium]